MPFNATDTKPPLSQMNLSTIRDCIKAALAEFTETTSKSSFLSTFNNKVTVNVTVLHNELKTLLSNPNSSTIAENIRARMEEQNIRARMEKQPEITKFDINSAIEEAVFNYIIQRIEVAKAEKWASGIFMRSNIEIRLEALIKSLKALKTQFQTKSKGVLKFMEMAEAERRILFQKSTILCASIKETKRKLQTLDFKDPRVDSKAKEFQEDAVSPAEKEAKSIERREKENTKIYDNYTGLAENFEFGDIGPCLKFFLDVGSIKSVYPEIPATIESANKAMSDWITLYEQETEKEKADRKSAQKVEVDRTSASIPSSQVKAFKRIYKALRVGQTGTFYKTNFLFRTGRLSDTQLVQKIEDHAKLKPNSRTAKAWKLVQTHRENLKTDNLELFTAIYKSAFNQSSSFFRLSNAPKVLANETAQLTLEDVNRAPKGSRRARISRALKA